MSGRLGKIQRIVFESARAKSLSWLREPELADMAANAQVTLCGLTQANLGYYGEEFERSADLLVARGLLRKTKIGYALSTSEFEALKLDAAKGGGDGQ